MNQLAPNLFLIGPPRTGTTSLFHALEDHDEICVSYPKEPKIIDIDPHKGLHGYRRYFPHYHGEQYIVDASPYNSWIPYCAERIRQMCGNPKIIMTVRCPVARFYSGWRTLVNMRPGREPRSFHDFTIDHLRSFNYYQFEGESSLRPYWDGHRGYFVDFNLHCGLYSVIFQRFKRLFSDVFVLSLADIVNDPEGTAKNLDSFLGVEGLVLGRKRLKEEEWPFNAIAPSLSREELKEKHNEEFSYLSHFYNMRNDFFYRVTSERHVSI